MHLVTVTWRALLPPIGHDLLAAAVVLDETVAILHVEVFFHRGFNALDAAVIKIRKPNDVAKHSADRLDARVLVHEIDSAQLRRTEFGTKDICSRRGYVALVDDVA